MAGLDLEAMLNMQRELQEKYKGIWEPREPGIRAPAHALAG